MNKSEFIEELSKQTQFDEEKCHLINEILESRFIIGKKGKEQIVTEFEEKLLLKNTEADELYNTCMSILGKGMIDKLKHPFTKGN